MRNLRLSILREKNVADTRTERDFLGEREVPADAYYGVQTLRAVENFPISGLRAHPAFIDAMAQIKRAAAVANQAAGKLPEDIAGAVIQAADEIIAGEMRDQFVVDVFQAGAGTSGHMNVNEVLANRAIEILGGQRGDYERVHPNDHVNLGQSTNDVFPTAMRLAALRLLAGLRPALRGLRDALQSKAEEFASIVKAGRTHLQDAAPLTLGQEFGGYAAAIAKTADALAAASHDLRALGIGGTAVGTGLTAFPGYRQRIVQELASLTDQPLRCCDDTFEAMQSMAPFVRLSGELRALAAELIRIANDLRLLSAGPNTGLAEITLPAVQPGSSIMPGKVNPVIAEMMNMVAFHVIGNDHAILMAAQAGQLELNVMMPVINLNLLQSIHILANAVRVFTEKCVSGIQADAGKCRDYAERSIGLATLLKPVIGYHAASELAREAAATGKSVPQLAIEKKLLTREQLDAMLSPEAMSPDTAPGPE